MDMNHTYVYACFSRDSKVLEASDLSYSSQGDSDVTGPPESALHWSCPILKPISYTAKHKQKKTTKE